MPKLTKRAVDAAAPRVGPDAGDYFVWDDDVKGFGLRVWPTGRKTFVFKYRLGGRDSATQRVTLGDVGALTPDEARRRATRLRADVFAGRSPTAERAARKRAVVAREAAPTLAEVADGFLAECDSKLRPTTVAEYRRLLGVAPGRRGAGEGGERAGELRAALGRLKVADVTRGDVSRLHLGMAARPYMANKALAALSALFAYAERHGARPEGTNPCRGIADFRESKRERYLTDAEFAALGDALRRGERAGLPLPAHRQRRTATAATAKHRAKDFGAPAPFNPAGVAALRFLLLSGWREREALSLEWAHVDFGRGCATLPQTKTGRSVRELGAPALAVLEAMRVYRRPGNPYVFPGAKPGTHFTDTARLWDATRHAAGLPDVRLHDLRHAFASVAASGGLTLSLIGALLGHTDSATTARYAHLIGTSRRRAADSVSGAVAAALAGSASLDGAAADRREGAGPTQGSLTALPFRERA